MDYLTAKATTHLALQPFDGRDGFCKGPSLPQPFYEALIAFSFWIFFYVKTSSKSKAINLKATANQYYIERT